MPIVDGIEFCTKTGSMKGQNFFQTSSIINAVKNCINGKIPCRNSSVFNYIQSSRNFTYVRQLLKISLFKDKSFSEEPMYYERLQSIVPLSLYLHQNQVTISSVACRRVAELSRVCTLQLSASHTNPQLWKVGENPVGMLLSAKINCSMTLANCDNLRCRLQMKVTKVNLLFLENIKTFIYPMHIRRFSK